MKAVDFFKTDFVNFGSYDNFRKIASYIDNCGPSSRKCIYTLLKKNVSEPKKLADLKSIISQYCLKGNTKILLADGNFITIEDWYNNYKELKLNLISYDIENDLFVKSIGSNPIKTKSVNKTIEIILENNDKFECTEDHKILVNRNNKSFYIEASDLKIDDEIVSLY